MLPTASEKARTCGPCASMANIPDPLPVRKSRLGAQIAFGRVPLLTASQRLSPVVPQSTGLSPTQDPKILHSLYTQKLIPFQQRDLNMFGVSGRLSFKGRLKLWPRRASTSTPEIPQPELPSPSCSGTLRAPGMSIYVELMQHVLFEGTIFSLVSRKTKRNHPFCGTPATLTHAHATPHDSQCLVCLICS